MNTLFGTKGTMSQTFIEGFRIPVTKITLGPCVVTQIKNEKRDGYWAIQLGTGTKKQKNTSKALQGHLKETKLNPRDIKEVRLASEPKYKVGDIIKAGDVFHKGDVVSVAAVSKGKGFAGGVKRYGFRGGPKTHGQSDRHRAPGSIGQTTTPGRVYKGKKMAGRMGGEQITIKNLHIIEVDNEKNEVIVSGAIPGRTGIFLTINKIKAGTLKDLEHEVVATIVEGEPEEVKEEVKNEIQH